MFHSLKRFFRKCQDGVTLLFVPHNNFKTIRLNFSLAFILFLFFFWLGITIWAVYLTIRHFDYWRLSAETLVLKTKTALLAKEIEKSNKLLEEVEKVDRELRRLLKMDSREKIIEKNGKGGPTLEEEESFQRFLRKGNLSASELRREAFAIRREIERRIKSWEEIRAYIEEQHRIFRATPNCWPTRGRLTSRFGARRHLWGRSRRHAGIDLANCRGTPIYATADGKVTFAGWRRGYGNVIYIEHGYGYTTLYAHCWKMKVKRGDQVKRGDLIAWMGATGRATGPHIHYEVRYQGKAINPLSLLKKRSEG